MWLCFSLIWKVLHNPEKSESGTPVKNLISFFYSLKSEIKRKIYIKNQNILNERNLENAFKKIKSDKIINAQYRCNINQSNVKTKQDILFKATIKRLMNSTTARGLKFKKDIIRINNQIHKCDIGNNLLFFINWLILNF